MSLIYRRRDWMKGMAAGIGGLSMCNWLPAFAAEVANNPNRRRHCILLWMSGGPSQMDTFDMKPGHENGGEFKEIETNVPGMRFCEHLPKLSKHADKLAIVRSLQTKEGDHSRGTYLMRTGQKPMGTINYPSISSTLGKALGKDDDALPRCVSVAPYQALNAQAFGPGFLGPKYSPLIVNGSGNNPGGIANIVPTTPTAAAGTPASFAELKINALEPLNEITAEQIQRRRDLWKILQKDFVDRHTGDAAIAHQMVYERSMNMMTKETAEAFDLTKEPKELREAYGTGVFGQGCLMARRLIERGVPVVEVSLGNGSSWDNHNKIFDTIKPLLGELDAGWATLIKDLDQRGLLESTTILWMGEFGRTPKINGGGGRDHFPAAWSCVFAGGGIKGGQVYGSTSKDGNRVEEKTVDAGNILSTFVKASGVNPGDENLSNVGRPIKLVDASPIDELIS